MSNFEIRPINSDDAEKVVTSLEHNWGSTRVVSRRRMYHPEKLPGFVATIDGKSVGRLTYEIRNRECPGRHSQQRL